MSWERVSVGKHRSMAKCPRCGTLCIVEFCLSCDGGAPAPRVLQTTEGAPIIVKTEVEHLEAMIHNRDVALAAYRLEVERLQQALQIYADESNWLTSFPTPEPGDPHDWWVGDDGDNGWDVARAALGVRRGHQS